MLVIFVNFVCVREWWATSLFFLYERWIDGSFFFSSLLGGSLCSDFERGPYYFFWRRQNQKVCVPRTGLLDLIIDLVRAGSSDGLNLCLRGPLFAL